MTDALLLNIYRRLPKRKMLMQMTRWWKMSNLNEVTSRKKT